MVIVSSEPLVLIGPGSEWLWSTVAGLVAVMTLLAIYRQLRMQRGASAIAQMSALHADWVSSEAIARARLALLVAVRDATEPTVDSVLRIGNFADRIGFLVRKGHLDRQLVWKYFGGSLQDWYGWFAPLARPANLGVPDDWRWLVAVLDEMDRKAGEAIVRDETYYARLLPFSMASNLEIIQMAEELRSVIVRPKSPARLEPTNEAKRRPLATRQRQPVGSVGGGKLGS